jgi:uncharacterized Zn-finger protein
MDPEITTNSERERPSGTSSQSRAAHQEFLCPYCGDSFKRLEHLFRHKLSHSDDRPYQCPTCGKAFTRKCVYSSGAPMVFLTMYCTMLTALALLQGHP